MLGFSFFGFKGSIRTTVILILVSLEISICGFFLCSASELSNPANEKKYAFADCKAEPDIDAIPQYIEQSDLGKSSEAFPMPAANNILLVGTEPDNGKKGTVTSEVYSPKIKKEPVKDEEKLIYKFPIAWGNKAKAELSLTFDDGYDTKAIEKTLEVLDKAGIKGTFFVIGTQLRAHKDLWKKAADEGHQICNHTNNHTMLSHLTDEQIKKEISGWEQSVSDTLGKEYLLKMKKDFPFLRMPDGDGCKSNRILKIVKDMGYTNIWWSDETCYTVLKYYNLNKNPVDALAQKVSKHIVDNASSGSIILLHFNPYDTERLSDIVDGITKKGLNIKPLTEILKAEDFMKS